MAFGIVDILCWCLLYSVWMDVVFLGLLVCPMDIWVGIVFVNNVANLPLNILFLSKIIF